MRVRLVIADPDTAHAGEVARGARGHAKREKGTVHTEMDTDCPNGLPNCRHCGDPEHKESCQAQGHCPDCGTKHGVAPDSVLAKNGYAMEPL